MSEVYVIWSFEHGAWWRPARMGYTMHLAEAGHYSHDEADRIVTAANRYRPHPDEQAILLADAQRDGPPPQLLRVTVELLDGRTIEITYRADRPDEVIRHLRSYGVTPADIKQTIHHVPPGWEKVTDD